MDELRVITPYELQDARLLELARPRIVGVTRDPDGAGMWPWVWIEHSYAAPASWMSKLSVIAVLQGGNAPADHWHVGMCITRRLVWHVYTGFVNDPVMDRPSSR